MVAELAGYGGLLVSPPFYTSIYNVCRCVPVCMCLKCNCAQVPFICSHFGGFFLLLFLLTGGDILASNYF